MAADLTIQRVKCTPHEDQGRILNSMCIFFFAQRMRGQDTRDLLGVFGHVSSTEKMRDVEKDMNSCGGRFDFSPRQHVLRHVSECSAYQIHAPSGLPSTSRLLLPHSDFERVNDC